MAEKITQPLSWSCLLGAVSLVYKPIRGRADDMSTVVIGCCRNGNCIWSLLCVLSHPFCCALPRSWTGKSQLSASSLIFCSLESLPLAIFPVSIVVGSTYPLSHCVKTFWYLYGRTLRYYIASPCLFVVKSYNIVNRKQRTILHVVLGGWEKISVSKKSFKCKCKCTVCRTLVFIREELDFFKYGNSLFTACLL